MPASATTGHVRLVRDQVGVLLQIVPTLSDVTMSASGGFAGGNLSSPAAALPKARCSVLPGSQRIDDISRSYRARRQ